MRNAGSFSLEFLVVYCYRMPMFLPDSKLASFMGVGLWLCDDGMRSDLLDFVAESS